MKPLRAVGTSKSPADQTWRAGWPESADHWWTLVAAPWLFCSKRKLGLSNDSLKDCFGRSSCAICHQESIYSDEYWTSMVSLVKNKRASTEFLDHPTIAQELKRVEVSWFISKSIFNRHQSSTSMVIIINSNQINLN